MKLPKVNIEKCRCGDAVCDTHGLSYGNFFMGTGWPKAEAEEIAHRINAHETIILALKKIARTEIGAARLTAEMTLNQIANKAY